MSAIFRTIYYPNCRGIIIPINVTNLIENFLEQSFIKLIWIKDKAKTTGFLFIFLMFTSTEIQCWTLGEDSPNAFHSERWCAACNLWHPATLTRLSTHLMRGHPTCWPLQNLHALSADLYILLIIHTWAGITNDSYKIKRKSFKYVQRYHCTNIY